MCLWSRLSFPWSGLCQDYITTPWPCDPGVLWDVPMALYLLLSQTCQQEVFIQFFPPDQEGSIGVSTWLETDSVLDNCSIFWHLSREHIVWGEIGYLWGLSPLCVFIRNRCRDAPTYGVHCVVRNKVSKNSSKANLTNEIIWAGIYSLVCTHRQNTQTYWNQKKSGRTF